MSSSAVIKSSNLTETKRVLFAKPLFKVEPEVLQEDTAPLNAIKQEEDNRAKLLEEKRQLEEEIKALQLQHQNVLEQIENDKNEALIEIDEWWKGKNLEAQQLADQMAQQGLQQGFQEGLEQAERENTEKVKEIEVLLKTAYEERTKIIETAEPFLLQLSVGIAERILKDELTQEPEQILSIVREGLRQVKEKGEVTLRVTPDDYSTILPYADELKLCLDASCELKIIPDHNIQAGAMIDLPHGTFDVTIDSQLNAIKEQLLAYQEERISP
ncbi:FliH/SctL family protein [Niallia taxi]|uniref:FliH/SctL family protein n=1 Tax=Niallia taxi TaxID=2499688 RepID=UPI0015F5EE66|nr:FliH/SctL family protein [Niallia taxi]